MRRTARALVVPMVALALACSADRSQTPSRPPNVLVLSADSLRADRLALFNPGQGIALESLDRLAARGSVFRNTWAVAPWTAPSMVSVFTGLYPPSHGVTYRDDTTPSDLPTLARLAAGAGYRVGNFSFFTGISYFRNLGFGEPEPGLRHGREPEAFAAWLDRAGAIDPGTGRSEPGSTDAEPSIDAGAIAAEPFFAWIHLLEPHLPYGSSGYRATQVQVPGSTGLELAQLQATLPVGTGQFEPGDRERLLDLYDSDLRKLDDVMLRILDALEARSLLDDTVVVFVADHGEELLEDGWIGHASTAVEAKLIPEILHIPLIISGPGVAVGESHRLAQQVDVLPTVIELMGLSPLEMTDGLVLLPLGRAGPFASLLNWLGAGKAPRQRIFVDSSMGGNLTPVDRRGERLQAAGDGDCLLVAHTIAGASETTTYVPLTGDSACSSAQLYESLEHWRENQLEQRLAVLRHSATDEAPSDEAIAEYPTRVVVSAPAQGAALEWHDASGQLVIEWRGADDAYWIEYEVGAGIVRVQGRFHVEQERLVFGPFPRGFWNDLAAYSPFRFRVIGAEAAERSEWREFRILPIDRAASDGAAS